MSESFEEDTKMEVERDRYECVKEIFFFADKMLREKKGNFPAVCFGLSYVSAMLAIEDQADDPRVAFQLLLFAHSQACNDLLQREGKVEKKETKKGRLNNKNSTLH